MMIKHKEFTCTLDLRVKHEDDRRGGNSQVGHDKEEEQGRSMVEMLGVLAVVGVLSVGGIAGYTYAMNKHYANELLNSASQRAVILKAQKAAGLPLSLREFDGLEVAGGTFESVEELEDGSAFIIPVSGVKGAVCENLIKATDGTDITIAKDNSETLTDITEEDCGDENDNNLVFVFETGIGGASDSGANETVCDPACEGGQRCIQGVCVYSITDCPIEICDEDEYCYLAEVCSEICSEEYNETTGEYSYVCKTTEDLAKCPVEECWDDGEGGEYCELASYCNAFCSENDDGEFECRDTSIPPCNYNSDCNDWCQEQDGDCFCLLSGFGDGISGECALVDDYSSDASEGSRITWFAANNWCQAQGATVYNLTAEVLENGEFADSGDIIDDVCCAVGDCAMKGAMVNITLNGQPARVKCPIYESPRLKIYEGYGEYTPICD